MSEPAKTLLLDARIGAVEPFGAQGEPSAIRKTTWPGRIRVLKTGLAGDQQADRHHHGGPDKALHHYPFDHYAAWQAELPDSAALWQTAGAFGENLSTLGLIESQVCLGDVYQLGTARLQVSQGRQPCWKLNHRFGIPDMVARVRASGRTGWYYRVLEEGETGIGDPLELISRAYPHWPLDRLWNVLFGPNRQTDALAELKQLDVLAANWRERAG